MNKDWFNKQMKKTYEAIEHALKKKRLRPIHKLDEYLIKDETNS